MAQIGPLWGGGGEGGVIKMNVSQWKGKWIWVPSVPLTNDWEVALVSKLEPAPPDQEQCRRNTTIP